MTVGELLFQGYSPGVLNQFTSIISLLTEIIPASLLPPLPDMLLEGKFGLWYGKNNTMKDAYWTINTGDSNMEEYAEVVKFNGEEMLPERWWPRMGPSPSAHRGGYGGMCHGDIQEELERGRNFLLHKTGVSDLGCTEQNTEHA